jgi:hypothetical protein
MTERKHKSVAIVRQAPVVQQVSPLAMVASAVERGMSPETIKQLMDLADRHAATEARKAYTTALVELKRDLPTVLGRDKVVDFPSAKGRVHYNHTSLAAAIDAITPALTAHGFSLSWSPATEGDKVRVTCTLTHAQGHTESATLTSPADTSGSKSAAQGIASTITLLQRYSALSILGIATADMDEPKGEAAATSIDTERNLRAVKAAIDKGHTKEEAEAKVGKPVAEWTVADLDTLRGWLGLGKKGDKK